MYHYTESGLGNVYLRGYCSNVKPDPDTDPDITDIMCHRLL